MINKRVCTSLMGMILFIVLSMCIGIFALENLRLLPENANICFLGTSVFFIGQILLLTLFRFTDLLVKNVKVAGLLSVLFGVGTLTFDLFGKAYILTICKGIGLERVIIFSIVVIIIIWLNSIVNNDYYPSGNNPFCPEGKINAYSNLGTVHSSRSVNVMKTAMEENRIPMIGLNYGIPLVLTWLNILGDPFPYFTEALYYGINNAAAFFFVAGFIQECFGGSSGTVLLGAFFVFYISEGISPRYKLATDATGCTNPGICQYPDVWMMVSIALFYFKVIYNVVVTNQGVFNVSVFNLICAVAWGLLAPQIGIMVIGAMGCCIAGLLIMGEMADAGILTFLLFVLMAGMLCSARLGGGMLQQKDKVRRDIYGNECFKMKFKFGYYGIEYIDARRLRNDQYCAIVSSNAIVFFEVFALPLLTLIVYFIRLITAYDLWEFWVAFIILVLLGGGCGVCYFLSIDGGYKSQLTRFLAPALVLSKIAWVGIVINMDWNIWKIAGIALAAFLMCDSFFFYLKWIKRLGGGGACLLPVWFMTPSKVVGSGRYDADSVFNTCILKNNVRFISSLKELRESKVFIYGTGNYAEKLYQMIKGEESVSFAGFIDSKSEKWRDTISGYSVFSPQQVGKSQRDEIVILGSNLKSGTWSIYTMCSLYGLKNIVKLLEE